MKNILWKLIRFAINILLLIIFLFPFYWMFASSFKTLGETIQFPPTLFPKEIQWQNYLGAIQDYPFLDYLMNSIIVTGSIIIIQLLTMIPAAYAFARYKFFGGNFIFSLLMTSMMIPGQLTFISIFTMMANWGWINTYWSLIIPSTASIFGIFMLRQTFMQIPDEIIEAAKIDNASEFQIMRRIMLPLAKPTIVTMALLSFIGSWNEYFWPLIMTTNDTVRTLPVGISMLRNAESLTSYNILMAGNMILVIPTLIVYIFAQNKIINSLKQRRF